MKKKNRKTRETKKDTDREKNVVRKNSKEKNGEKVE